MWPGKGEALDRTIQVESALADLYAEGLRQWAPAARRHLLPDLTGVVVNGDPALLAAALPPDPTALAQTQSLWDQHAEEIIVAGMAILWAVAAYETAKEFASIPDTVTPDLSTVALGIVLASVLLPKREVLAAVGYVESTPALKTARDEYLAAKQVEIAHTPAKVQAKVEHALADNALTLDVAPEQQAAVLRERAAEVIDPASFEMRELSRAESYQAAGVLNHAVMASAQESEDAPDLQKTWICTIDGRTRDSHFASDGARVPLAGFFTVGGAQLAYPGDPTGPPAEVANCRCRMGILAVDEPLPDEVDRHTERLDGRDSVVINRDGRTQAEEIERRAHDGNIRARDDPEGIGRVASAALSDQENTMAPTVTTLAAEETAEDTETYLTFTDALFAVTGVPTSDGRMLAADIKIEFRDTPLPLQWCKENEGGHYGSVTVGVIEQIGYKNGEVRGSGYMLNNAEAVEAVDLVLHGVSNPSVDLASCRVIASDAEGNEVTEDNYVEGMDVYATMTEAEVIATTLVATPAFGQTRFALNAEREARATSLVAAAAEGFKPRVYDPALFADPKLSGPTRLTITEDGHIFGHLACWDSPHRSVQLSSMTPPRNRSGYRHFHTSPAVHLADGTRLPVGRLTVGTGHAAENLDAGPAAAHYDNTGTCFALVRAYEDEFGIVISGVSAPWATPEQIEMGLSAPLSGDWRWFDGQWELVAALSVNTPGFIARQYTDTAGVPTTLVAALGPSLLSRRGGVEHLTIDVIRAAVRAELQASARAAELAAREQAAFAAAREAVGDPPTVSERIDQLLESVG